MTASLLIDDTDRHRKSVRASIPACAVSNIYPAAGELASRQTQRLVFPSTEPPPRTKSALINFQTFRQLPVSVAKACGADNVHMAVWSIPTENSRRSKTDDAEREFQRAGQLRVLEGLLRAIDDPHKFLDVVLSSADEHGCSPSSARTVRSERRASEGGRQYAVHLDDEVKRAADPRRSRCPPQLKFCGFIPRSGSTSNVTFTRMSRGGCPIRDPRKDGLTMSLEKGLNSYVGSTRQAALISVVVLRRT